MGTRNLPGVRCVCSLGLEGRVGGGSERSSAVSPRSVRPGTYTRSLFHSGKETK